MDGETTRTTKSKRSPADAVVMSLLFAGLGHQYVGEGRLALRILLAVGVGWSLVLSAAVLLDRAPLLTIGFSVAIGISAQIGLALDAYRRAKRHTESYELRPCNRPSAYASYFVLWFLVVAVPYGLRAAYVVESFKISADSMAPTFAIGDNFVVTKLGARDRHPQRGDIVVFLYPEDPREKFVKRLIGLPGETVQIRDGVVFIDGIPLEREEVAPPSGATDGNRMRYFVERTETGASYTVKNARPLEMRDERPAFDPPTWQVPAGHMFVMGDNRNQSHDSTAFGPVPLENLEGRARAIYLPFDRIGDVR